MAIDTYLLTKNGKRETNEDFAGYTGRENGDGCWVVCDGLGGHGFGELASRFVVNNILQQYNTVSDINLSMLGTMIENANTGLLAEQENQGKSGMKTTCVVMAAANGELFWGHTGDSRLYIFSKEKISCITHDHSVPRMLVDMGDIEFDQIRYHQDRSRLLKVMGMPWERPMYELCKETKKIQDNDAFLLCTDGFWEHVTEKEMEQALNRTKSPEEWLIKMENKLLRHSRGKDLDNYTAVGVRIGRGQKVVGKKMCKRTLL